jgi:NAD(P)H-flavin reductase
VVILCGARTPDDLLFPRDLERWRARFDLAVEVTVDRAPPDWRGHVGVAAALVDRAEIDPAAFAFVCGPEVMMRFTVRALARRGLADERVFLSMERNMKCAVGWCGHCQLGPHFICKDGPVIAHQRLAQLLAHRET